MSRFMVYKLYPKYFKTKWTQPFPMQAPFYRRKSAGSTVPHRRKVPISCFRGLRVPPASDSDPDSLLAPKLFTVGS